jgi:hypothetical protein
VSRIYFLDGLINRTCPAFRDIPVDQQPKTPQPRFGKGRQ